LKKAEERRAYARGVLKTRFFPTNQHLAELKLSAKALDEALKRMGEKEDVLAHSTVEYDSEAAVLGEKIEQRGGAEAVMSVVCDKKRQIKKWTSLMLSFGIGGALLSAVCIPFVLLKMYWGLGFLVFLSLPVIFTVIGSKKKKTFKAQLTDMVNEYSVSIDELSTKLEYCLKNLSLCRESSQKSAKAQTDLEEAIRAVSVAKDALGVLLGKTDPDAKRTVESALEEYGRLEGFATSYESMLKDEEALKRALEMEKKVLEQYDEQELRAAVDTDTSKLTPAAIAEAERMRGFLGQKKNVLEHKIMGLRDSVVQLKANLTDPIPIADNIAELEKKHSEDTEFYMALELAMESIEKAGSAISGSVMPAISEQAGELMSRISADKYNTVRTTGNLAITLDSDGYGIKSDYLSAGTRDAAYLALRMALFMRIYSSELPPLILDEALCQLDDTRAQRLLELLCGFSSESSQCLLFTSHKREERICKELGISYTLIRL